MKFLGAIMTWHLGLVNVRDRCCHSEVQIAVPFTRPSFHSCMQILKDGMSTKCIHFSAWEHQEKLPCTVLGHSYFILPFAGSRKQLLRHRAKR